MTTMPLPTPPFQAFLRGLAELFKHTHGHAGFVVADDGALVPTGTTITVKQERGESLEAFHTRLRRDYGLRPGDTIDILNNNGKCDTARLYLRPRA